MADLQSSCLLLVDIQEDFLQREGLTPARDDFLQKAGALLAAWREAGLPVIHVHTLVGSDGEGAMPHWQTSQRQDCRAGSAGARAPAMVQPESDERVVHKRFFSAFGPHTGLDEALRELRVEALVIAGLYTHACVRAAAFDAYERGFAVTVAGDAIASTEPLHAELTRRHLEGRACRVVDVATLVRQLPGAAPSSPAQPADFEHHAPASGEWLHRLQFADVDEVERGVGTARSAGAWWARADRLTRAGLLRRWRERLQGSEAVLLATLVREVGKPIRDAREEFSRALAHLDSAIAFAADEDEAIDRQVRVRHAPVGCIGLITPWNNPLAIPIGKIAPALAFGNSVVWKPAPQALASSALLFQALQEAGLPEGLVAVLNGAAAVGERLLRHPALAAISLTGSIATGRIAAACCQASGKALQAELGGNNAAIVWPGAAVERTARDLCLAGFGFAGQRCTAIRRIIVHHSLHASFAEAFVAAAAALPRGDLMHEDTVLAPLISRSRVRRMEQIVGEACGAGVRCLHGGHADAYWRSGNGFAPTILAAGAGERVFREESFGPIVVLTPADTLESALQLANAVPHGLLAGFYGGGDSEERAFMESIEAGMLRLGAGASIHPEAPFSGWKASALGVPEHGRWDREFYARPQAVYGGREPA